MMMPSHVVLTLLVLMVALSFSPVDSESLRLPNQFRKFMKDLKEASESMMNESDFLSNHKQDTQPRGTSRPLVAILAQPVAGETPTGEQKKYAKYSSYIAASYVKYVEAAGARAVPIMYNMPREEMERRFKAVNALLLPGGGQNICDGPYAEAGKYLLDLANKANAEGDYFPVWGTCLGFEQLAIAYSKNCSVVKSGFNAEDDASPLILTEEAGASRLLGGDSPRAKYLQHLASADAGLAMENHGQGVSLEDWTQNAQLHSQFKVLSYSLDRDGRKYVSTIEGRDLPIYATQWHPEKNLFEWTYQESIPHSAEASQLTQGLANFLVEEARRSSHAPASKDEELDLLMYNYMPSFTGRDWPSFKFDQCYFFE